MESDTRAIRRLNRLYAVSSGINEAIVRLREPGELYERACRIAVEQGRLRLAWVGICDSDGRITPVARYGADDGYVDRIILTMRDEKINRGPAGRALRTGVCAVSNDIASDGTFFWKDEALRRRLRSCAVFPLRIEGRPIGILAIYAEEPDYFHDEELRVMNALADNISFAVESARHEIERKKAEQERARLEARLHQSQKMESLGTLAGGIAHDFNNILTAMMGNAQLASMQLDAEHPVQQNLVEVERAGLRAADLIRQILTFTRRQEPRRRVIKLQGVVEEALRLMRATLPARIRIEAHYADALPKVLADPTQMHQIVMNLCTNAAQAIGERDGRVEIRLDEVEIDAEAARRGAELCEGRMVRLSVIDDGCGMDESTIGKIFDPFFTTKEPGHGTGLGLSVVHGIVRGHDAAIAVESRPGEGTAFHLYFPALDADAAEDAGTMTETSGRGAGEHILYVDDEAPLVVLAEHLLGELGYRVSGHTDPLAALADFRARPHDFDAVVTDLSMPGMSGTDLVRELLDLRRELPVIMTTGYLRPEDAEDAARLGVRALILKPDTIKTLIPALRGIFNGNGE